MQELREGGRNSRQRGDQHCGILYWSGGMYVDLGWIHYDLPFLDRFSGDTSHIYNTRRHGCGGSVDFRIRNRDDLR